MVLRGSMCILLRSGECRAEMDFTRKRVLVRGSRKQESAKREWGLEKESGERQARIHFLSPRRSPEKWQLRWQSKTATRSWPLQKKKGKDGEMDPACGSPAAAT